jgi:hypothetical protein
MGEGLDVDWKQRARDRATLRMSGSMRPGWCGKLATGLARRGIGIDRGHAMTVSAGSWLAEFQLVCPALPEPSPIDVGRLLAARDRAGFTTPIVLSGYTLETSDTRGGCLALEVEGEDRVGFLAALLRRLAFFALFPVELQLDTVGATVRDQLWLRGGGGRAPLPSTGDALAASLDALVKR